MPQASDSLRALMQRWFGSIGDNGPWRLLKSHGFMEDRFVILPPTPSHTVNDIEWTCIAFLEDEWDWAYQPLDKEKWFYLSRWE